MSKLFGDKGLSSSGILWFVVKDTSFRTCIAKLLPCNMQKAQKSCATIGKIVA
jgi:hypothetical protein